MPGEIRKLTIVLSLFIDLQEIHKAQVSGCNYPNIPDSKLNCKIEVN
jgi:hypothetical protein